PKPSTPAWRKFRRVMPLHSDAAFPVILSIPGSIVSSPLAGEGMSLCLRRFLLRRGGRREVPQVQGGPVAGVFVAALAELAAVAVAAAVGGADYESVAVGVQGQRMAVGHSSIEEEGLLVIEALQE